MTPPAPTPEEYAELVWIAAEAACQRRHPSVPKKTACTICWTDEIAKALATAHARGREEALAILHQYLRGEIDHAGVIRALSRPQGETR